MTSWIWKYFNKDAHSAVCKSCEAKLSIKSSTWGLRRHLQTKHQIDCSSGTSRSSMVIKCDLNPSTNEDETNSAVQTISEIPRSPFEEANQPGSSMLDPKESQSHSLKRPSTPLSSFQLAENSITNGIAKMIAVDMLPLSFCENKGFRNLMEIIVPDYPLPTRSMITQSIERLHFDTKATLSAKLNEYNSVAVTTDIWDSQDDTSHLTVTAHAVTFNWQLVSHVLSTIEVHPWYTAENLRRYIGQIISEWHLSEKIIATVHESTTTLSTCVRKSKILGASVPCFGHALQSAVNKALRLPDVCELLKKASNVVKHFHQSSAAAEALKKTQMEHDLPIVKLLQGSKIHWNSVFYMVQRLNEHRHAISKVLFDDHTTSVKIAQKIALCDEDWANLQHLEELLEPLEAVTTVITAAFDATLSITRPIVHGLCNNFYSHEESETERQSSFKTLIRDEFLERYLEATGEGGGVALIATFLDPRYKELSFESEDVINATTNAVQEKIDELGDSVPVSTISLNRQAALEFLFTGQRSAGKFSRNSSEMASYVIEPCIDTNNDPCQWWRDNEYKYPRMAQLARRYLAIPAVSNPAEQVLENSDITVSAKRSRLAPEHIDPMIFMHQNADLA